MTLEARLRHARYLPISQACGPTPEQLESYRIARELYRQVVATPATLVDEEYAGLKRAMDAAGVPWTPGQGVQRQVPTNGS